MKWLLRPVCAMFGHVWRFCYLYQNGDLVTSRQLRQLKVRPFGRFSHQACERCGEVYR